MTSLYLIDTSILSEFAPERAPIPDDVAEWMDARAERSFISVISLLELERGIAKLARQGHSRKARLATDWLDEVLLHYGSRVLDVDGPIAQSAGRMEDNAIGKGFSPGLADSLIGATAMMYDGVVLTRNLKHFQQLGVECADPFRMAA